MKRVLFLSRSLGAGGAERRMVTVANLLKDRGYEVELVCYDKSYFFGDALRKSGIAVSWLNNGSFISKLSQIRKKIKSGQFAVTISFLPTLNIINCLSSISLGHKVITGESSASSQFEKFMGWKYVVRGYIEDILEFLFADAIVSNSDNACTLRKERSRWLSNKLLTIHNPVSVPTPKTKYNYKEDGKLHIVVAASVQAIKNPLMVVKAIGIINSETRNKLQLDWYGNIIEESLFSQVSQEIENSHLSGTISFHQATKEIAEKMYQADVVALFSIAEGLPNAICEGMMLGKPIIMTRISDYKKMVDANNGFLCDSDDANSIVDAFIAALNTPNERLMEMGEKSKEKALTLFSPKMIGDEWERLIENK